MVSEATWPTDVTRFMNISLQLHIHAMTRHCATKFEELGQENKIKTSCFKCIAPIYIYIYIYIHT